MFKRYSFLILCFTIAVNASDADFDGDDIKLTVSEQK